MKTLIATVLMSAGIASLAVGQVTAIFPTRVAWTDDMTVAGNKAQTRLALPIGSFDMTVQVVSAERFPSSSLISIDDEIIKICGISGNSMFVCAGGRGFDGTVAANHGVQATVSGNLVAYHFNRLAAEVTGIETSLGAGLSHVASSTHTHALSSLTGTLLNAQLPASIDAGKIGDGTVSNTQFQYLGGATSNIQTQLNSLNTSLSGISFPSTWTPPLSYSGSTVSIAQATSSVDGYLNHTDWATFNSKLANVSSSDLSDFAVSATGTTLTIGAGCSSSRPCSFRFGNTIHSFTNPATATISAGTGTAYVYATSAGDLVLGSTVTASCTAVCSFSSGVHGFAPDVLPIATITATSGAWNTGSVTDYRTILGRASTAAGTGIINTSTGGVDTLSVDPAVVSLKVAVPSTATDACTAGTWSADAGYYYLCVATDTWKRAALSTW
jgi:hypothetical protein